MTQAEHDEAFHDGMEAAYGNLAELVGRLHDAGLHLLVWIEGTELIASVDGMEGPVRGLPKEAWESSVRFAASRFDELLGALEDWCNEWLPTGHEVRLR
jgi:hypothetical protein